MLLQEIVIFFDICLNKNWREEEILRKKVECFFGVNHLLPICPSVSIRAFHCEEKQKESPIIHKEKESPKSHMVVRNLHATLYV